MAKKREALEIFGSIFNDRKFIYF